MLIFPIERRTNILESIMKFFTTTLLAIALVAVGWRYVPQNVREKLLGAIGIAARGDRTEIKHYIQDVVLPKDPQERRAALAGELEKNIAELKRRIEADENGALAPDADAPDSGEPEAGASDATIRAASARELIGAAGDMVKELESTNKDAPLVRKAAERILNAVLPASASVCPAK